MQLTYLAAQAEADEDAQAKLDTILSEECDLISCPSCGAITQAMRSHRVKFFGSILACFGIGVGALLAVHLGTLYLHRIFIFPAAAGLVLIVLGVLLLVAKAPKNVGAGGVENCKPRKRGWLISQGRHGRYKSRFFCPGLFPVSSGLVRLRAFVAVGTRPNARKTSNITITQRIMRRSFIGRICWVQSIILGFARTIILRGNRLRVPLAHL